MRDRVADKRGSGLEVGTPPPDGARSGVRPALPVDDALAAERAAPRFLIVDDDETIHRGLVRHLAPYARVDGATTAADGRRLLAENEYALVLVDLGLPEGPASPEDRLDPVTPEALAVFRMRHPLPPRGLDVAREARASSPRATIVLFTGTSEGALPDEARRLSRVCVVLKPWPLDAALEVAARVAAEDDAERERTRATVRAIVREMGTIGEQAAAVFELLALGVSRDEIATTLGISLGTVSSHISALAEKANVPRVDQLVDRVLRRLAVAAHEDAMHQRAKRDRR